MNNATPLPDAKKVGMVSLGCPKNRTDSEVMLARLGGAGYELTDHAEDADVVVELSGRMGVTSVVLSLNKDK